MGEPIKSGEVERTESFDRQGNQTTREFSFVLHILTIALNIKIKCGILISHSCAFRLTHAVLASLETPLILGRFATTCSG